MLSWLAKVLFLVFPTPVPVLLAAGSGVMHVCEAKRTTARSAGSGPFFGKWVTKGDGASAEKWRRSQKKTNTLPSSR
jgi:hypothetical protein